jgi:hypothetical protein
VGNRPSAAIASAARAKPPSVSSCEPMWTCSLRSVERAPGVVQQRRRLLERTPNLSSLPPVETEACVSPGTSGLIRTSTFWLAGARRLSRATSSALSITISPTPASTASAMSSSDFALPCRRIFSGSKPACSAIASSPLPATSQPTPPRPGSA